MNRRLTLGILSGLLTIVAIISMCSTNRLAGPGTGSETTNGIVATVRYQNGSPASFSSIKIRPVNFLKDTMSLSVALRSSGIDTLTDSAGRFSISTFVGEGEYAVEIIDTAQNQGALIKINPGYDSLIDYGVIFLNPLGGISGAIDRSSISDSAAIYVQVYGLDKIKRVDAATGKFFIDKLAIGDYGLHIFSSVPTYIPQTVQNIAVVSAAPVFIDTVRFVSVVTWFNSKSVYLNTTSSGADVTTDIYRFPVLCRLTTDNFDFLTARTHGEDVRFVKSDNTPLSYQIERWDAAAGVAEIWVSVDTVFGNNATQHFTMLWGNSNAADASNGGAVFDTGMGFQGVWHMSDTDGVSCLDATNNHYDGVLYAMSKASSASGAIGGAQMFDGATNYIVMSNTADGKLNFPQGGRYSVSAWVYDESLDGGYHCIVSKSNQQYGLQVNNQNMWQFFEFENKQGWASTEASASSLAWKYVVGVRSGTKQYIYIDGVLADSSITLAADVSDRYTSDNVCVGKRPSETNRWWSGMIDEVRICSWAHGSGWIKLCYMNQKSTDALVSYK
jgi:hypothetical protein